MAIDDPDAHPNRSAEDADRRGGRRVDSSLHQIGGAARVIVGLDRQTNGERRPAPQPLARGTDGSAVQLHQLKNDAEPETKSGVTSRRRTVESTMETGPL